jgi:hypothetical protein
MVQVINTTSKRLIEDGMSQGEAMATAHSAATAECKKHKPEQDIIAKALAVHIDVNP